MEPLQTTEYLDYAADFRAAARGLLTEAQGRNVDGVSYAYTVLVAACIQCHKHVRGARRADESEVTGAARASAGWSRRPRPLPDGCAR